MSTNFNIDNIEELSNLIKKGLRRSTNFECKPASFFKLNTLGGELAFSKLISAIANTGGGTVIIGIKCSGKKAIAIDAISLSQAENLKFYINHIISPEIKNISIKAINSSNNFDYGVIIINIPNNFSRPFMACDYKYYTRSGIKEILLEEHQIRMMYNASATPIMEFAGIYNTNGIPVNSNGCLELMSFYPKFLIRNAGNAPATLYKFELYIPSDIYDPDFMALQNYFNRLEGIYSVFSFNGKSPVFQGESLAIAEAKLTLKANNYNTFSKSNIIIKLYTTHNVKEFIFSLSETFTFENKILPKTIFDKKLNLI